MSEGSVLTQSRAGFISLTNWSTEQRPGRSSSMLLWQIAVDMKIRCNMKPVWKCLQPSLIWFHFFGLCVFHTVVDNFFHKEKKIKWPSYFCCCIRKQQAFNFIFIYEKQEKHTKNRKIIGFHAICLQHAVLHNLLYISLGSNKISHISGGVLRQCPGLADWIWLSLIFNVHTGNLGNAPKSNMSWGCLTDYAVYKHQLEKWWK